MAEFRALGYLPVARRIVALCDFFSYPNDGKPAKIMTTEDRLAVGGGDRRILVTRIRVVGRTPVFFTYAGTESGIFNFLR